MATTSSPSFLRRASSISSSSFSLSPSTTSTIPSTSIIYEGYLSKQGHIFQSWNRRYFILTLTKLLYYTDQTQKKLKGEYVFNSSSYLQRCDPIDSHRYLLKLHADGTGGTELIMEADNEDILLIWEEKINFVLNKSFESIRIPDIPSSKYQINDSLLMETLGLPPKYEFLTHLKIQYDQFQIEESFEYIPLRLQHEPIIHFETLPKNSETHYLSLFLVDLDSPSPTEPLYRDFVHWAIVNISNEVLNSGQVILPYLPPCPPYNSGCHSHRYPLNIMKWATLNQFSLVGLNYFTSSWDESVDANLSQIQYVPPSQYRSPEQIAVYRLPLNDPLAMVYLGSHIASYITYELCGLSSGADFRTLYEIISSPFLKCLIDTGFLHSYRLIEAMQSELSLTKPISTIHQRIQLKYQQLNHFLSSMPSSNRNWKEFFVGDWTHADFFLFLPIIMIRYYGTPQLYSTVKHLMSSVSETLRDHFSSACQVLCRLLELCLLKKCTPISAIHSLLSDHHTIPLTTIERQFLDCSLSDSFYSILVEIHETLSSHPQYPKTEDNRASNNLYQEFLDIRLFLLYEIIQNSHNSHTSSYSLDQYIIKLSPTHRKIWEEAKQSKSSEQETIFTINQIFSTLSDISSGSYSDMGTVICLMYILKSAHNFTEAIELNIKIGGEIHLRSPLCGLFFTTSCYPLLSSNEHYWSITAIPPKWISSIPEIILQQSLESIQKIISTRQQTLLIGDIVSDRIGLNTIKYLCSQYSTVITPVLGVNNLPIQGQDVLRDYINQYNLIIKDMNFNSSESILYNIDKNTKNILLIPSLSTKEEINLIYLAIDECIKSSNIQHILLISLLSPTSTSTDSTSNTSNDTSTPTSTSPMNDNSFPFLLKEYYKLENYLQNQCSEKNIIYSILRIPPFSYTESSSFILNFMEILNTKKIISSLFLNQYYPFIILNDLCRSIACLLSLPNPSESKIYHLYTSIANDQDVIPILSKLSNQHDLIYQSIDQRQSTIKDSLEQLSLPSWAHEDYLELLNYYQANQTIPSSDLSLILQQERNNTQVPCTLNEYLETIYKLHHRSPSVTKPLISHQQSNQLVSKEHNSSPSPASVKRSSVSTSGTSGMPTDSVIFQGRWALKKLYTETKYKKRFIWIDMTSKTFHWSKVEGKDSKNKSLFLDYNAGVRVTAPVYIEPKDKTFLHSASPGGVMWSIGDGRGGSIDIQFYDEDINYINSPALSEAKEWIRMIEKILEG